MQMVDEELLYDCYYNSLMHGIFDV